MNRKNFFPLVILLLFLFSTLSAQSINKMLKEIASEAHGHVGAGLYVVETKKSAWLNGSEHFPMQSVYKFPIAMASLALVDNGTLRLDEMVIVKESELIGPDQHSPIRDKHPEGDFKISISDLLRYAVSESDGTASDVLMRLVGGSEGVMKFLKKIGVTGIRIANTELEMGKSDSVQYKNWATPKAAVKLLEAFYKGKGLKPESRGLLLKIMTDTQTGQNRLKGLLPKGTSVAHKTGSSRTVNGMTAASNDIGIITLPNGHHLLAAVFVSDSHADEKVRDKVIAQIARLGFDKL